MRLIGKTIGSLLQVDHMSLRNGVARVRITLPLNDLVRLDRMLRVLSKDVIHIQYRYERLVDRCRDCMMLNHDGLACPRSLETSADQGMQSETAVISLISVFPNFKIPSQAEQSSIGVQCVFIVGLSFVSRSISSLWPRSDFDFGLSIFVDLDSPTSLALTSLLGDLFGAGFIFWSSYCSLGT
ncbi:hypothetical protein ACLB2K_068290 [Fragaria x ananassa]